MLKFKDAAVDAKFESDFIGDPIVHVPGGTTGDGWKGNLSLITLSAAEKLLTQESNLVRLKKSLGQKISSVVNDK